MVNIKVRQASKIGGKFKVNNQWYWADIVRIPGADPEKPYEFMVFLSDEDGNITNMAGEYMLRLDSISEEKLIKCIEKFCKDSEM